MSPTNNPQTANIGSAPQAAKTNRLGDTLTSQIGALLSKALTDAASLEVRTFTNEAGDTSLASADDPLVANTRLRAFTRIALDGDTQMCIPILASGEPDETLWKLHSEAVAQARKDRATTVEAAISILQMLAGR